MRIRSSLRLTVSLGLFATLAVAAVPFTLLVATFARQDLEAAASRHVVEIAQTVVRSTRLAMLLDDREAVTRIIAEVSKQPEIVRLRLLDSFGEIIDSNHARDVGHTVDKKEEPCLHCHAAEQAGSPTAHVPIEKRWRIIEEPDGHRSMVAMAVIENEPSCTTASCHEHKASQKVLGVVNVTYSLQDVDRSIARHSTWIVGIWLGFVALLALGAGWVLQRKIYRPLRDLEAGAARFSRGELDHAVPVRGEDEFARVAGSFNAMGAALQQSQQATANLIQTLEARVEERSRQVLKAQAEAAHGEKLASIGMLASGIAHELNNPLTGVLTFTSLLRKKMPAGSHDAEDLDLVIRETKRCAGIIRRLLDFAREKVPVKGLFDLNGVVKDTVTFVERSASLERVTIDFRPAAELPTIFGDADLIKQVLLNILVNAQQAITGPGRIDVVTRLLPAGEPGAGEAGAGPIVEVAITDTGSGIEPKHLEHIFDPFFTTKEVGKGTGLGLSVSYGIIKSHGGNIDVQSTVGEGTTFRIQLPVEPPAGQPEAGDGTPQA